MPEWEVRMAAQVRPRGRALAVEPGLHEVEHLGRDERREGRLDVHVPRGHGQAAGVDRIPQQAFERLSSQRAALRGLETKGGELGEGALLGQGARGEETERLDDDRRPLRVRDQRRGAAAALP